MSCAAALGLGAAIAAGPESEDEVHLVVLEAADGADGEGELGAEVDGGAGGLEGAQVQDDTALLQAHVEAEVGGERRGEVVRRTGAGLPGGVGGGEGRALEERGGRGEGVGDDDESRGESRHVVGGRAGGGEGEEVDGLGEVRVEGVEGVNVDRVRGREGDGLGGERAELEVEGLFAVSAFYIIGFNMRVSRTPLTMRVPTRVIVPLTRSLRGVLMTSVLPGSMGASRA